MRLKTKLRFSSAIGALTCILVILLLAFCGTARGDSELEERIWIDRQKLLVEVWCAPPEEFLTWQQLWDDYGWCTLEELLTNLDYEYGGP